ncbi:uncharacterized protein EDB91DRAFT_1065875 [Suillus paluster]|uniref:uncharacterized protein n=1 Tax=Suillus paluster TaxID=48578 RepID=UPI001B872871|nr:uncharacterized protein EDB91DRAFT_1065875 [Suillus paluster]KAG1719130.1 hypothetical protein EDB91DRAFT_1065875 [Suillus paluster]
MSGKFTLENILGRNHEQVEHPRLQEKDSVGTTGTGEGWDEESANRSAADGFCVECEDQPAQVLCDTCADNYCEVCFAAQHRKGSRKKHVAKPLASGAKSKSVHNGAAGDAKKNGEEVRTFLRLSCGRSDNYFCAQHEDDVDMDDSDGELDRIAAETSKAPVSTQLLGAQPTIGSKVGEWFIERSKFIPLRLTYSERKFLRLLDAALQVSEYTDKIDTLGSGLSKPKRIVHQIRELCAILSGLVLAADYKQGQELFTDRDFRSNAEFYQTIFELGRRHKIMNPDKMRTTYGKLIYLLQDSQSPDVRDMLSFSCVKPIISVYNVLEDHNALDILRDDLIMVATQEIYSDGRSKREVQRDIKNKERAIETLSSKYQRSDLSQEQVRQCIYSIGDNHAFLRTNRDPCEKMIMYLKEHFHPTQSKDNKTSLAIRSGKHGARLSHDHAKQYAYVLQSLTLWREILHDMFRLWSLAEQDLLAENVPYRLRDTGQGLNRVQAAPKTFRMMHTILHRAQQSVGSWVGSSAIHMGDHNVPNALMFIDKYSQIYRILLPICNTLSQIPSLADKPALRSYIEDDFGSIDNCMREILCDFFQHGFDGSGADNFFDAGSCIDGRLTSAWNWCAQLEKKRYFPVFLLTGFVGFDGDW